MANVFGQITSFRRTKEVEADFFRRKLMLKDLEEMDFGGDGNVNSEELYIFMVVTLVSKLIRRVLIKFKPCFGNWMRTGVGV